MNAVRLASRSLLLLSGAETRPFLHALVAGDLAKFNAKPCLYTFLLNAKGRIVTDLMMYRAGAIPALDTKADDAVVLETDSVKLDELERLLKLYRLRRKIDIVRPNGIGVNFVFPNASCSLEKFEDPRLGSSFGYRSIGQMDADGTEADYLQRRIEFGIAEGSVETTDQIPMAVNADFLDAVSFDKGCYIGQELIARTHFTGIIRKRIMPFHCSSSEEIKNNTHILDKEGKRRGKVVRALPGVGLGIVSVEAVATNVPMFSSTGIPLEFSRPQWWPSSG